MCVEEGKERTGESRGDGEEKKKGETEKRKRGAGKGTRAVGTRPVLPVPRVANWLSPGDSRIRGAAGLPGQKGAVLGHAPEPRATHRCPNHCALKPVPNG